MRECIGDRRPVGTPKQHEQPITQRGERVRSCALRRMPRIFPKRHVPHIMQLILNRPMAAPQRFDRGRASFLCWQTDHAISHLAGAFPGLEHDAFAFPSHDLLHIRPIDILNMRAATPQAAGFQPTMPFFRRRPDRVPHLVIGWVGGQRKEHVQIGIQGGLVFFDDHQIVI